MYAKSKTLENKNNMNYNIKQKQGEKSNDPVYLEKRKKNNEAPKRSRDARRAKGDEISIRCAFLKQENMRLKLKLVSLESEAERLRMKMIYNHQNRFLLCYDQVQHVYTISCIPDYKSRRTTSRASSSRPTRKKKTSDTRLHDELPEPKAFTFVHGISDPNILRKISIHRPFKKISSDTLPLTFSDVFMTKMHQMHQD
ncbi:hypothetical protein NQ318_006208 [Aromia moschata]|uniref:BZIP domain-containing protein n=1 Tax=Aromia moschata TaxID=1265417 RepID=A0AAV8YHF9_9CUCU|nr:hypothetical protein NQ318_006208 [Aromia moschata]